MSKQPLLTALGKRMRELRESRAMGLQELSERAGWSRRFLVDAEAGRANPSISKVADLAQALGCPLHELTRLPHTRPQRFALVGLRGAGKSTLGRRLADQLEVPFDELDTWIERRAGMPISAIFELEGSSGYRRHEAGALEDWLSHHGTGVLAAPGGMADSPTFERLLASCYTIWLQAEPEDHLQRVRSQGDTRPMQGHADARARIESILEHRAATYSRCDLEVMTSGLSLESCVTTLVERIQKAIAK